jgi:Family of unknown function (DUF5681)
MQELIPANTDSNQKKGRFKPGQSGNPKGKPRGSKHRLTVLAERLMEDNVEGITNVIIAKALDGNLQAAALILSRVKPVPKGRRLSFSMPTGLGLAGIATAFDAIMAAVGQGAITTDEAAALAAILEKQAKILEVDETQRRLAALEAKVITHG